MNLRPYKTTDKAAVLQLLKSNTPTYFDPTEQKALEQYLEEELEEYFVVEAQGQIIGAGGINYFPELRKARIAWDLISPDFQGKGIGRKLTEHRIQHLNKNSEVDLIIVRTSQIVYEFYEKLNFQVVEIKKDFWAPGYDLYLMEQSNK